MKRFKAANEVAFDRRPADDADHQLYDIWTVDFISETGYRIFEGIDVKGLIFGTTQWEHPREVGKAGWTTESRRAAWKALKGMDVLSTCFAKLRKWALHVLDCWLIQLTRCLVEATHIPSRIRSQPCPSLRKQKQGDGCCEYSHISTHEGLRKVGQQ